MDPLSACRTCLSTTNLSFIFEKPDEYERYRSDIFTTTGIKVEKDDGLPQKMCTDCETFIKNSIKFRQRCKDVEIYLNNWKNNLGQSPNLTTTKEVSYECNELEIDFIKIEDIKIECLSDDNDTKEIEINNKDTSNLINNESTEMPIKTEAIEIEIEEPVELPYRKIYDDNAIMQRVTCKLCSKNLSLRSIDYHIHKYHPGADKRKVKCELCDSFIFENKLERHKLMMHGAGDRCAYCKLEFHNKDSLISHLTTCLLKNKIRTVSELGRAMVECDICHKIMQKASIRMHKKIKHAGLGPVCEHCGKRFANKLRLNEHLRARHGYQKLKCNYCAFESSSMMAMKNHERRHRGEKPFVCESCGAKFHALYLLAQHRQSHRTEKLYKCDQCSSSFKANNSLQMHKRSCHSDQTYRCGVCFRTYNCKHYAVKHIRRVHGHTGSDLPISCEPNDKMSKDCDTVTTDV